MSKNEKMMILEMLEKGQITADEAARLLQAAGTSAGTATRKPAEPVRPSAPEQRQQGHGMNAYTSPPSTHYSAPAPELPRSNDTRRVSSAPSSIDNFSDELSRKFDTFIKDIEPRVQRFTEVVVEKTAQAADKISRSLSTPPPTPSKPAAHQSVAFPSAPRPAAPVSTAGGYESSVELKVSSFDSELNLSGLNGNVLIKGYNGDKISARLITRPKRPGAPIELMTLGSKYFLNYDENDFHQVSIDAYVPESMFYVLKISSIGGLINVSTMKTTHVVVDNVSGETELNSITADSIKVDCQNGNLRMSGLCAANGSIENFNGSINASNMDISKLSLSTFNGTLNLNMSGFYSFNDYTWSMEASNGKMNLYLPSAANIGYHMKAHASLGDIKIGLTGINYIINEKSFAEAKSFNFDTAQKQVRLVLETSNAPLIVN